MGGGWIMHRWSFEVGLRRLVWLACSLGVAACSNPGVDPPFGNPSTSASRPCTCGHVQADVVDIALLLQKRNIMYSKTVPKSDDAGIVHQFLDGLSNRCRCFAPPPYGECRTTRQLAAWYYDQGDLWRVNDPVKDSDLIDVGTVMFFGSADWNYADHDAADLFRRGIGIEHMGVVVYVQRDEHGRLQRYTLFHAIGRGQAAGATYNHTRELGFGNEGEPWIAVASLVPTLRKVGILRITSAGD